IVEGTTNTVVMSLLGVPASATLVPAQQTISSTGTAVTVPLTVTVYDASGNQITGSDRFAQPVAIELRALSQFGSGLRVSVNGASGGLMNAPADAAALQYIGRDGSGAYTIAATTNSGAITLGTASFAIQPGYRMAQQIFTNLANADL